MTVGALVCLWVVSQTSAPFSVPLLVTMGFMTLVGVVLERIIRRPLIGQPIVSEIMVKIGH
jgi:branched-chain amino acid transport system permease protein